MVGRALFDTEDEDENGGGGGEARAIKCRTGEGDNQRRKLHELDAEKEVGASLVENG